MSEDLKSTVCVILFYDIPTHCHDNRTKVAVQMIGAATSIEPTTLQEATKELELYRV